MNILETIARLNGEVEYALIEEFNALIEEFNQLKDSESPCDGYGNGHHTGYFHNGGGVGFGSIHGNAIGSEFPRFFEHKL